jgi:hypothetical protein
MMQHTQTHEKNKKMVPPPSEKSSRIATSAHGHHNVRQIPSMTPIKTESTTAWIEQQRKQSIPDLVMATSSVPPLEHSSMINSRTLPLPTRRASFSAYNENIAYPQTLPPPPLPSNNNYRLSYPVSVGPYCNSDYPYYNNNIPRNRSSWPIRREPYKQHYPHFPPPQQHHYYNRNDDNYNTVRRRSSTSTLSSDSTSALVTPTTYQHPQQQQDPHIVRRRISIDDLRLPIESLRNIQVDEEKSYSNYYNINNNVSNDDTVDITPDEYEALEGFSKFHSSSVVARDNTASPAGNNKFCIYHFHITQN